MNANLPFRFQAGSKPLSLAHHHRSTTKSSQKSFKSRHATKGAVKEKAKGRIDSFTAGERKTPHQQLTSNLKASRRNRAKQKRLQQQASRTKAGSIYAGRNGAARVVAVIPLGQTVIVRKAVEELSKVAIEGENVQESGTGVVNCHVSRFKQNMTILPCTGDIMEVLETSRMADYVLFVLDAVEAVSEEAENLLRAVESQGISTVLACVQKLNLVPNPKKRTDRQSSLKAYMNRFFPTVEKVHSLQNAQECLTMLRVFCTTLPKGIHWREERPWIVAESVKYNPNSASELDVVITGVVRGKPLKADRLVQLGSFGTYQISKITAAPPKEEKKSADSVFEDSEPQVLDMPSEQADTLQELADDFPRDEEEVAALELEASRKRGVLIDDEYFDELPDQPELDIKPKRLPKGTSSYQAAWYIGNVSDTDSDLEDVESEDEDMKDLPLDVGDGAMDIDMEPEIAPSEAANMDQSMVDDDDIDDWDELEKYNADDDLRFPDEIELHPNDYAREKLAGYRGLKNFRTSVWDTRFDALEQPAQWRLLLEIANYKAAKNKILKDSLAGGVEPGTRVCIHISHVSSRFAEFYGQEKPFALFQLLQHEGKRAALHFSITLDSSLTAPLQSDEQLLVVCGPRTFTVNALFSDAGNTPNDVHKYRRFLHPGQTAAVSFVERLTWGSIPTLFFSKTVDDSMLSSEKDKWTFVGKGTSLPPSTSRVVAERVVLTGHPVKIHKRVATIRWMFFNPEDVAYFRGLRLWTKGGRSGFIKESLGTHGRFKAEFDGKIGGMEMVGVSLYRRLWPKVFYG